MKKALLLMLVGALTVGTAVSAKAADPRTGNKYAPNFTVSCPFSHRSSDDPLTDPGRPGAAHSHDFFGNRSTDAWSTDASLRAAPTTCRRPGDTAAYWMPTVYEGDAPVAAVQATVYYRNGAVDPLTLASFAPGFRMIAGDPHSAAPARARNIGWACRHASGRKGTWTSAVPTCPAGQPLVFRIRFPECWNGRDLDAPDHRSHVAYPMKSGECPPSHATRLPRLSMTETLDSQGGPDVRLSAGAASTSGHADFINSWDQSSLETLIDECLRRGVKCGFQEPDPDA